ncbi:MAG TPA: RNA-binding transcriptional accessory protein [Candidatus Omnitrophica bacterium]|nr:MAG: RNA-binding transcriptional accessory protein [Omnitrophica WOR_2 bacterium GWA2_45_18]HBR13970.1 RNA-binding transcriptional accessory protein [Candidatus Omnitrophota bacterium]
MIQDYNLKIAGELGVASGQVGAVRRLLEENATVPFIARYRKEMTGNLDEVAIAAIRDRYDQLLELDKRRETILQSIQEQGKLTDALKAKILAAVSLTVLEDIYLPYRPKRRTRATVAKEKGLEPLAQKIFAQEGVDPEAEAVPYVSVENKVESTDEALAGARDIIAEWINEDVEARRLLRVLFHEKGLVTAKVVRGKEEEGVKFKDYYQWQESLRTVPSHRYLAVLRGEKETFLMARILAPEEEALQTLERLFVKGRGADSQQVQTAAHDSFKRLLSLSLETETRFELKKRADQEAIEVFKNNLRQLLMAPPLGQKNVLAVDPGYRTGCKLVCLNPQGKFLHNDTIYLSDSDEKKERAARTVKDLCQKYNTEIIAIGNGTASRETETFIRGLDLPGKIPVLVVSESGASIYSASEAAREEFPDHDITVRGAVSIGRRLMDPLAELVKIDPKNIGVGQYQHDVDQKLLNNSLDDVVVSCVNQVGVEVNTASQQLLTYVSGLGPARARAIIEARNAHGPFASREALKKVAGLGPKAFEQAAGFLRIFNGENPLDASAVHPESYLLVDAMAKDLDCSLKDLLGNERLRQKIPVKKYVTDTVGIPTLTDILGELAKPGRDPREPFQIFTYKDGVETIDDLKPGMKLPGVVTNVTAFGAFVDVGVHHDGLVHISQLCDRYVKDPHEVVKVHQKVQVTVLEIDLQRKRIALSLKKA